MSTPEVTPAKLVAVSIKGGVDVIDLSVDEVNAIARIALNKALTESERYVALKISLAIANAAITDEDITRVRASMKQRGLL